MKLSHALATVALAGLLATGAFAKGPKVDVSGKKHPNLNAAQKALKNAADKITEAQKANEYDMAGHAAKAKELIDQADAELKLAAEAANENKK
ncbi:MAG: hypothetical protein JST92_02785 [Deltaproteobacteria bacterium]|nr:hypothetical protein [Deltaproteobacteria bacterium]